MRFRRWFPAVVAAGMICWGGSQAHGFELLDRALSFGGYGDAACGAEACSTQKTPCVQKTVCAPKFRCAPILGCAPKDGCAPAACLLPRGYLLKACAEHLRAAALELHCKTKAVCDSIKARLACVWACTRCCEPVYEPACGMEGDFVMPPESPIQTEVQK